MILSIAALVLLTPPGTWYVDAQATAPGLGTFSQPYTRIDYALAQSSTQSGDVILVSPGDYVDENIDFLGKAVSVESTGSAMDTWISGLGAGSSNPHPLVTAVNGESDGSRLKGFTLRDASGRYGGGGGALYCFASSPSIEACRFENNFGGQVGTAAFFEGGAPSFINCWFGGNGGEGSVFAQESAIKMTGCFFADSASLPYGSLRLIGGSLVASNCYFDGQVGAVGNPGTAMHVSAIGTRLSLSRCHFRSSLGSMVSGRGLYLEDCASLISESTFTDMHPQDVPGGAFLVLGGALTVSSSSFVGCATELGVGGATALVGCFASFSECDFRNNTSASFERSGGAIYKWGPQDLVIDDCLFDGNLAGEGGAIHLAFGPAEVTDSYFLNNVASTLGGNTPPARGGAIVALGPLSVEGSTFVDNLCSADVPGSTGHEALGGAIYLDAPGQLSECTMHGNVVSGQNLAFGGAVFCAAGAAGSQMDHLQLRRNRSQTGPGGTAQGGALTGFYSASHCSFFENEANDGGASIFGGTLDHCILAGATSDEVAGFVDITYSLVEGGFLGQGNIDGDPLFWGLHDLHLMPGSPCIDSGDPLAPLDLDGTPADMGAIPFDYEHCGPGCLGLISTASCNSNPNSTGYEALTRALGSQVVSDNLVILVSEHLPVGMLGFYLAAPTSGFTPNFGGGNGNLCLGSGLLRLNSQVQFVNVAGQVSQTVDLTQMPQGAVVNAGSTWTFQLWFRDPSGAQYTTNTSSAAQVDFQ